jgi:hypothetical protein
MKDAIRYYLRWLFKNVTFLCVLRTTLDGRFDHLCRPSYDLCLEGYPSSGNSFLFYLLKEINPTLKIGHHTHTVANIRLALWFRIPTVIIVRNPCDVISSIKVRIDARKNGPLIEYSIENALLEYIDLYKFVYNNRKSLLLVDFQQLVGRTKQALDVISRFSNLDLSTENTIEAIVMQAKEKLKQSVRLNKKYRNENNIAILPLPVEKRNQDKDKMKEKVINYPSYKKASDLYEKLNFLIS